VAGGKGKLGVVLVVTDPSVLPARINAIGRAFPQFNGRSNAKSHRRVQIFAVDANGKPVDMPESALVTMAATRDAAELVDTPPTDLNPEAFAKRARAMLAEIPGVKVREITGDKLLTANLGGIHAVGRAAVNTPRMLIASYSPKETRSRRHVALVGKGVTFDTGGLHLKPRGGIEGMKSDMGGAAAVLGAFRVLASTGCQHQVTLVLCMAENSISHVSYKPDDIITMHSGKTVEINNTDAEGRLLLADGVSYAARELEADTIIDAATLTGAQLVALGTLHAAVMSNEAEMEQAMVEAGRASGDLAHALPFAPEFYQSEFSSQVADMCNSVRNRMNAQSSCAAQFVYSHITGTKATWCHIDLAGPAFPKGRGTGYGVALISTAVAALS
jgi:probable aminopeptidase NPEPL1